MKKMKKKKKKKKDLIRWRQEERIRGHSNRSNNRIQINDTTVPYRKLKSMRLIISTTSET